MSDGGDKICPLCAEEMDLTDQQLKPCKCGYEICVWCWHHIIEMAEKDGAEGRCPNCRTAYDKERIVGAASNCRRVVVAETNADKKQKSQKGKSKPSAEARKQLSSVRVIQRNLVYIIGLPLTISDVNILERREYFGQYGKVLKVSISRSTGANQQPANTLNAYITYAKEDEAVKCIQAVHNFVLDGKPLRACFGTTKYCNTWLRNLTCSNPDCFYLHDVGNQEDSFTKDEIISAYTRTRIPQIATNSLQNRMGSVLPPPVDDFCTTGSTTTAKCALKNSTTNSVTPVKGSTNGGYRSNALPAAASWGSRILRHTPTSSSCDKGKQKQDSPSLSSVPSSPIQTSTWPDDVAKYAERHGDNHSIVANGNSRHSESSQSSTSNDSQVSSAWDDDNTTLKIPEECGKEDLNGGPGLVAAKKTYLASEVLGSYSGQSVGTYHEGGVIASAWDDDDDDATTLSIKDENKTQSNDQSLPLQTSKSGDSKKEGELIEAPAKVTQTAKCASSLAAKGYEVGQIAAEGLEVALNHIMDSSNDLSNLDDPLHSVLMKNSSNVTSNGKMENALSSLNINRHQFGQQGNNEYLDNDPIALKPAAHSFTGLDQLCDQFKLFGSCSYGETPAVTSDSFLSREPSVLHSLPMKEVAPITQNEIKDAAGLPEIHHQPENGIKTSYPCSIQASNVTDSSVYLNNSFDSTVHMTDIKRTITDNRLVQNDSKLRSFDTGRNCKYGRNIDPVNRLGGFSIFSNGEAVRGGDTGENNIISDILSMDFDPWSDSFSATNNLVKQLRESAGLNTSFDLHSSLKSPSNSQSRFSFARQDYQPGYFGSGSQDSIANGFQNGYTTHTMHSSSPFISNIPSDVASDRSSGLSRAKVSAPPGFSAPSRPPPPGFSSQDRSNLLFNSVPSGNQNLMNFSTGNHSQHVSAGDVEFIDPAILAVGKGTMPVKYDLGVDPFFSVQRGVSDTDSKHNLSVNLNLSGNQLGRISGHSLDGILPMNDGYASHQFIDQNHSSSRPFSQMSLNSFLAARNSGISNAQWDYWNHLQSGNGLDTAEISKNDRLGINNYSLNGEDYKFYMANANKLYNQGFGM